MMIEYSLPTFPMNFSAHILTKSFTMQEITANYFQSNFENLVWIKEHVCDSYK